MPFQIEIQLLCTNMFGFLLARKDTLFFKREYSGKNYTSTPFLKSYISNQLLLIYACIPPFPFIYSAVPAKMKTTTIRENPAFHVGPSISSCLQDATAYCRQKAMGNSSGGWACSLCERGSAYSLHLLTLSTHSGMYKSQQSHLTLYHKSQGQS